MAISTTLESGIDGTPGTQRKRSAVSSLNSAPSGSVTVYCYNAAGVRGRTTDITQVPTGAEVEWTVP